MKNEIGSDFSAILRRAMEAGFQPPIQIVSLSVNGSMFAGTLMPSEDPTIQQQEWGSSATDYFPGFHLCRNASWMAPQGWEMPNNTMFVDARGLPLVVHQIAKDEPPVPMPFLPEGTLPGDLSTIH